MRERYLLGLTETTGTPTQITVASLLAQFNTRNYLLMMHVLSPASVESLEITTDQNLKCRNSRMLDRNHYYIATKTWALIPGDM